MYKIGAFPGKFCPPHEGHMRPILRAASECDRLFVVVADSDRRARERCHAAGWPFISRPIRAAWMFNATSFIDNVIIRILNENNIPDYPDGSEKWNAALRSVINAPIDAIYGGDRYYEATYAKYQPNSKFVFYDRAQYPMSSTLIRDDLAKYWDYMLKPAQLWLERNLLQGGTTT